MNNLINLSKLMQEVNKKKSISDEVKKRKVINACSERYISKENLQYLLSINQKEIDGALVELSKPLGEMSLVKDMVVGETLKKNIRTTAPYIDDEEEIY